MKTTIPINLPRRFNSFNIPSRWGYENARKLSKEECHKLGDKIFGEARFKAIKKEKLQR